MRTTSMPWYNKESYPRIRKMMKDGNTFPLDFDSWNGDANRARRSRARNGEVVYRVMIDPEDFSVWCNTHGRETDGDAREKYATEAMHLLFRDGKQRHG